MIGQTLSHFKITAKLGEGGMGEVYLAQDLDLKRQVAMKVLPEDLASDPDRMERFQREAEALAALNHPNIVTIFSIEQAGDRRVLTMERVEGRSLAQIVEQGRLDLDDVFEIAIQLADALAAAHVKGITHRDLKPANLMLTDEGRLKVLDFGLAKLQERPSIGTDSQIETMALTREGIIVGTVPYMAPEQIGGEPVDHRADIFSLGVVLYELSTGRRPFRGKSGPAVISAVLKETPTPIEEIHPALPSHLSRVVQRCLEKDPSRRYQSALDVCNEIESLRRERASESGRAASPVWSSGRRRGAVIAAALGLVAALGLWQSISRAPPPLSRVTEGPPTIAVLPFENLGTEEDAYFASGMSDEITSRLGTTDELGVVSRRSALAYAGTTMTPQQLGEELDVDYILFGTVRWASSDGDRVRITPELVRAADGQQLWSEAYDRVIDDIFVVQSDIAAQVSERLGAALLSEARLDVATPTVNPEAYTLYLKGRHFWNKRTEENIQRALSYFEQAVDLDPGYALAWVGIADVWIFRGWYSILAPMETFPRAKEAAERALAANELQAEAHTSRAHIHLEYDYDWEAAEREYLRAIELDPKYPVARHWYGGYLSAMGRHEEALEQAHMARQLDPLAPIISTWVGLRHYFAGRFEVAIEEYGKALELAPSFAPGHWHLGWAYEQTGRFVEAIEAAQRAIEASDGNPLYIASLGHTHAMRGDTDRAYEILADLDRLSAATHIAAYHSAVIEAALGDADAAFGRLDAAFEERSPWIAYLAVDPRLAPLRADPRFELLLARAGLAQQS